MERLEDKNWLDEALTEAIGSEEKKPNFDKWKQGHPQAVEMLTSRTDKEAPASPGPPMIRRIIMKSPITKLAAAAVIIIAVVISFNQFVGTTTNVAWAEVASRFTQVDYVHMYIVKSRGDNFFGHGEAWHAHGKTVVRGNDGSVTYDDGRILQYFDKRGMLTVRKPSILADGQTFLEYF